MIFVVINFIAAVPVFMSDRSTFLPLLMLDVCAIVVMVLGKGAAAHKACGEYRECQNNVQLFHWELLQRLDAHEPSRVVLMSGALALNVIRPDSVIKKNTFTVRMSGTTVRKPQPENWVSDAAVALVLLMVLTDVSKQF
jgi:hypothetical protein